MRLVNVSLGMDCFNGRMSQLQQICTKTFDLFFIGTFAG